MKITDILHETASLAEEQKPGVDPLGRPITNTVTANGRRWYQMGNSWFELAAGDIATTNAASAADLKAIQAAQATKAPSSPLTATPADSAAGKAKPAATADETIAEPQTKEEAKKLINDLKAGSVSPDAVQKTSWYQRLKQMIGREPTTADLSPQAEEIAELTTGQKLAQKVGTATNATILVLAISINATVALAVALAEWANIDSKSPSAPKQRAKVIAEFCIAVGQTMVLPLMGSFIGRLLGGAKGQAIGNIGGYALSWLWSSASYDPYKFADTVVDLLYPDSKDDGSKGSPSPGADPIVLKRSLPPLEEAADTADPREAYTKKLITSGRAADLIRQHGVQSVIDGIDQLFSQQNSQQLQEDWKAELLAVALGLGAAAAGYDQWTKSGTDSRMIDGQEIIHFAGVPGQKIQPTKITKHLTIDGKPATVWQGKDSTKHGLVQWYWNYDDEPTMRNPNMKQIMDEDELLPLQGKAIQLGKVTDLFGAHIARDIAKINHGILAFTDDDCNRWRLIKQGDTIKIMKDHMLETDSPGMGDIMVMELADGRAIQARIAELRGNSLVLDLDETAHQWLDESPEHADLMIRGGDLSDTARQWNRMVQQLPADTPKGWAAVFAAEEPRLGQAARTMAHHWARIWRQQHEALGDSLTRGDARDWADEVNRALDQRPIAEQQRRGGHLRKWLDPKDPAMLAVWMAARAGSKGQSVKAFAQHAAREAGHPPHAYWDKIKKMVHESKHGRRALMRLYDIEPVTPVEDDFVIASDVHEYDDNRKLTWNLYKKVVLDADRWTPAYYHVAHLDLSPYGDFTRDQLIAAARDAMQNADVMVDEDDAAQEHKIKPQVSVEDVIAGVIGDQPQLWEVPHGYKGFITSQPLKGNEELETEQALFRAGYDVDRVSYITHDNTDGPRGYSVNVYLKSKPDATIDEDDESRPRHYIVPMDAGPNHIPNRGGFDDLAAAKAALRRMPDGDKHTIRTMNVRKIPAQDAAVDEARPDVLGMAESAYSLEKRYYIVRKDSAASPTPGLQGYHQRSEADKKLASMPNSDQYMVRAIDSHVLPKDEMQEQQGDLRALRQALDRGDYEQATDLLLHVSPDVSISPLLRRHRDPWVAYLNNELGDLRTSDPETIMSALHNLQHLKADWPELGQLLKRASQVRSHEGFWRKKFHDWGKPFDDDNQDSAAVDEARYLSTPTIRHQVANMFTHDPEKPATIYKPNKYDPETGEGGYVANRAKPDTESQKRNIVLQLFRSMDMSKAEPLVFDDDSTMDITPQIAMKALQKIERMKAPQRHDTIKDIMRSADAFAAFIRADDIGEGVMPIAHEVRAKMTDIINDVLDIDIKPRQLKPMQHNRDGTAWMAMIPNMQVIDDMAEYDLGRALVRAGFNPELVYAKSDPDDHTATVIIRLNQPYQMQDPDYVIEAKYQGREVRLGKPIRTNTGEGGKFKVYVRDPKTGNIKMVRFGDTTGLTIKRDDPKRRKNFRARHHCDNPGPRTKARYWSCKMWTRKPVGKILKGK